MKRLKAYRTYVLCCIAGVGSYLLYDVCMSTIYQVNEYSISIDGHAATSVRAESISHFKQVQRYTYAPDRLCVDVMRQFDWIQSMDLLYLPNKTAHVNIITHSPVCVVNNDYVATSVGKLLSKDIFEDRWIRNLPSIRVTDSGYNGDTLELSDACMATLRTIISSPLLSTYYCVWEHNNKARLYDKSLVNFSIVFHPNAIPDATIIRYCEQIKKELIERHVFDMPRAKAWVADVRFKNQIVVSQEKRGGYDTNIR